MCLAEFTLADRGDRAVSGAVLQPLDCWDRRFESRSGHICSCVVCFVGSGLCYELITRSGESYRVCLSNFVVTSKL